MGIFSALTNAVTGLRAQSYALENISGNIANSQTTAFKRIDTSFQDMIPDAPVFRQTAGSVSASSRATNTVQGDLQGASIGTFMAVNGDGFFVVQKPSSTSDNRPVFEGLNLYTRRGDFTPDKNGYLVNGAGYYLMGIPIDSQTSNPVGSVPQVLQFNNDFLPASPTTLMEYRANLASNPLVPAYDKDIPRSELLNPVTFSANPLIGAPAAARIAGTGAVLLPDAPAVATGTEDISALASAGGSLVINGQTITITAGDNAAAIEAAIDAATGTTGVSASLNAGQLVLTSNDADTNIVIGGGSTLAVLTELGLAVGTTNATNLLSQSAAAAAQTLTVTVGAGAPQTITFGNAVGQVSTLAELNTALAGLTGVVASADPLNGNMTLTASNSSDNLAVGGTVNAATFGLQTTTALPATQTIIASDVPAFLDQTISGMAVTAYDAAGAPVNIQMRWAKTDAAKYGGADTWQMFYQVNSSATGLEPAWKNAGVAYTFGPNGQLNPPVTSVTLANLVVDGVTLGDVKIDHGAGGITQFADPNGTVQVNLLQQNGFPAGDLQSVAVSDKGRITGAYSNGRTIELAAISLANFNGTNFLKRLDGGAFEITDASGPPIFGNSGKIVGGALEGSNTDIADEFTKLIVTQQAYSANTRIISTSNEMVQDLLNMLR